MKKLITILLAALSFYGSQAQNNSSTTKKSPINKIYLQTGAGGCSQSGSIYDMGLQTIINNKWSVTLSYHGLSMQPGNVPADYQPETGTFWSIPFTGGVRNVNMKLYSLTAGRYFPLSKKCWFTTEAGLSIVKGEKVNFKPAAQVSSDVNFLFFPISTTTSNYSTSIENKSTLGGMFTADFNWAFLPFMGLGAGIFANINSIELPIGFRVKLTMGAMRQHIKAQRKK